MPIVLDPAATWSEKERARSRTARLVRRMQGTWNELIGERAEDELLTAVSIPIPPAGHGHAYEKLKRKVGDYATAAAAVVLTLNGDTCESASVALTNVGQTPLFAAWVPAPPSSSLVTSSWVTVRITSGPVRNM